MLVLDEVLVLVLVVEVLVVFDVLEEVVDVLVEVEVVLVLVVVVEDEVLVEVLVVVVEVVVDVDVVADGAKEAKTPADSVEEPKSIVIDLSVSAPTNVSLAPVYVTKLSRVPSKSSVNPVHAAVEAAAVRPAPIANPPAGMSKAKVGSSATLSPKS